MDKKLIYVPPSLKLLEEFHKKRELKDTFCNPDDPEEKRVPHKKKYINFIYDTFPPKQPWECSLCGYYGTDIIKEKK